MKIKNILVGAIALSCTLFCQPALASDWTISVQGQEIDAKVEIINGRSLVPLRTVGSALGLKVDWDEKTRTASLTREGSGIYTGTITLNADTGKYTASINGGTPYFDLYVTGDKDRALLVKPENINGSLYVPVRVVCDSFGAPVDVTGNRISIGKIFSASDPTIKKVEKLLDWGFPQAYKDALIDLYDEIHAWIEGEEYDGLNQNWLADYCYPYPEMPTLKNVTAKIGYCLYDINKDGSPELIIGDNKDGDILSIYSCVGSTTARHLLCGWARNHVWIHENGIIEEFGSGGANSHSNSLSRITKEGNLTELCSFGIDIIEEVKNGQYTGEYVTECYSYEGNGQKKYYPEKYARETIDGYIDNSPIVELKFNSLDKYYF